MANQHTPMNMATLPTLYAAALARIEELERENKRLKEEGFTLAAGQCIVQNGGLMGDDHGHQFCDMERQRNELRRKCERLRFHAEAMYARLRREDYDRKAATDYRAEFPEASYMRELASVKAERDALKAKLSALLDTTEYWINRCTPAKDACERDYCAWLALGHHSNAVRNAIDAARKPTGASADASTLDDYFEYYPEPQERKLP